MQEEHGTTFEDTAPRRPTVFRGIVGRTASETIFGRSVLMMATAVDSNHSAIGSFLSQVTVGLILGLLWLVVVAGIVVDRVLGRVLAVALYLADVSVLQLVLYLGSGLTMALCLTLALGAWAPIGIAATIELFLVGLIAAGKVARLPGDREESETPEHPTGYTPTRLEGGSSAIR